MAQNGHLTTGEGHEPCILDNKTQVEAYKDLQDMFHHIITVLALQGRLVEEPLSLMGRILDYGTATGIWAINAADAKFGSGGEVVGVDEANVQPELYAFEPWEQERLFDLIHTRIIFDDLGDWPAFYKLSYENLASGGGYQQEALDLKPHSDSDDKPLPNLASWADKWYETTSTDGKTHLDILNTTDHLKQAGFGDWLGTALRYTFKRRCFAPPPHNQQWPLVDDEMLDGIKEETIPTNNTAYYNLYVWTARKPSDATPDLVLTSCK
nr:methyltransferase domain-containing protein [Colletotrichum truncatum]KAF6793917.1 methyltransferase domain-containing protein [Colletotrichum truncatum]